MQPTPSPGSSHTARATTVVLRTNIWTSWASGFGQQQQDGCGDASMGRRGHALCLGWPYPCPLRVPRAKHSSGYDTKRFTFGSKARSGSTFPSCSAQALTHGGNFSVPGQQRAHQRQQTLNSAGLVLLSFGDQGFSPVPTW